MITRILNLKKMQKASKILEGEHNFKTLQKDVKENLLDILKN